MRVLVCFQKLGSVFRGFGGVACNIVVAILRTGLGKRQDVIHILTYRTEGSEQTVITRGPSPAQ
jgi:hypothetical protein